MTIEYICFYFLSGGGGGRSKVGRLFRRALIEINLRNTAFKMSLSLQQLCCQCSRFNLFHGGWTSNVQ